MSFWSNVGRFFTGERNSRQNIYDPDQQQLLKYISQQAQAGPQSNPLYQQGQSYLSSLLGNDAQNFENFAAPYRSQFENQILPGIAERYAGQGTGGNLSSSSFRNSLAGAGSNYVQGLAALRENLRMQAVPQALNYAQAPFQTLNALGSTALARSPYQERQGSPGLLGTLFGAAATGLTGGIAPQVGKGIGDLVNRWFRSDASPSLGVSNSRNYPGVNFDSDRD